MRWMMTLLGLLLIAPGCVDYGNTETEDDGFDGQDGCASCSDADPDSDDGDAGPLSDDAGPRPDDGGPRPDGNGDRDGGWPDAHADGGDEGPGVYPECEERGGRCTWVEDMDSICPDGTYNPFSGYRGMCPTGSIQFCCIPNGGFGSPCTYDDPCDNGACLGEVSGYPPGGLCSEICEPDADPSWCPDWAICLPVHFSAAMGACMLRCDSDWACREGWTCQAWQLNPWDDDYTTTNVCWAPDEWMQGLGAPCGSDDNCLSGYCLMDDTGMGICSAPCDADHPCVTGFACISAGGRAACLPE